jgi:hypothetical protein
MHLISLLLLLPTLVLTRYLISLLYLTYKTRTLQSIPGPFWTHFTRLWYFRRLWNGHFEEDNIDLHSKYGPIVRIAPDQYSISDRAALKTIYGTGTKFAKSAWYEGWKHPDPERWTLFPDRDIKRHGMAFPVVIYYRWAGLIWDRRDSETVLEFILDEFAGAL